MDNSYEAYASNPRYSPIGLEGEIEREEMEAARKADIEAATTAKLDEISMPAEVPTEKPKDDLTVMHEKILGVVDAASRVPRDVAGGMRKATGNALSLIVGRENMDAANDWLRESLPGLVEFTDSFEKGLSPQGATSQVTQDMTQFMVPFGLYMKGIGAMAGAKVGTVTTAILADIAASGTALDPHMERFSSMVKSMGIDNKIIGWLADNENETESEGRLKNIIENAGMSAVFAGAFATAAMTMKGLYRVSKLPKKKVKPKKEINNGNADAK